MQSIGLHRYLERRGVHIERQLDYGRVNKTWETVLFVYKEK